MCSFVQRPMVSLLVAVFVGLVSLNGIAFAADPPVDVEALQAQLDEANKLLEQDTASHKETAEKKKLIDEKLAARKEREAKIFEELKTLCEEQDKLKAGTLDACMVKISN